MNQIPVSIFIVTLNEEKNIARVLKSCSEFSEVLVVDSGSDDKTTDIAESFGAKVIYNKWPGYAKQKEYAKSLCSNEWVLNLDADEELTPELVEKIKNIVEEDKFAAARFQRRDWFIDGFFSKYTKKPNNIRLYKKSKVAFDKTVLVHESAQTQEKELFVKEYFNHYGYDSIEIITQKNNDYSSLKAQEKFQKGKKPSLLKMILIFPLIFVKTYLLQGYIFSGLKGFIMSITTAYYMFIKEAKLYEYYKKQKIKK